LSLNISSGGAGLEPTKTCASQKLSNLNKSGVPDSKENMHAKNALPKNNQILLEGEQQ